MQGDKDTGKAVHEWSDSRTTTNNVL